MHTKTFSGQVDELLAEALSRKDTNILFYISFKAVTTVSRQNNRAQRSKKQLLADAMTTKSINIVLLQYTNLARENFNTQIIPFLSRVMKPVLADEHQIQQKQLAVSRIMLDTIWNITFSAEIMFMQTTNECTTLQQMENDCGCIRNSSLKSH